MTPVRVLCLDIEGGYGGSSRSLSFAVSALDRDRVNPVVWCKRSGPIQKFYHDHHVATRVEEGITNVSALPKASRSVILFAKAGLHYLKNSAFREKLHAAAERDFDIVHFNHEGLWWLAHWLRVRTDIPFTQHIRKTLPDNRLARFQIHSIASNTDYRFFITPNEKTLFDRLSGTTSTENTGSVVFNPMRLPSVAPVPDSRLPIDGRLKVCCLSSYSWVRGIDRVIDVADALRRRGAENKVLFVVAGRMKLNGKLPGLLGEIRRRGGSLADYAEARGVANQCLFLGHVDNPLDVLSASDALIKPTRISNPWGRDIIEAFSLGRPALSVGTWDGFVETGRTGLLQREFDPDAMAATLLSWHENPEGRRELGIAARERIADMCNPDAAANKMTEVWENLHRVGRAN